MADSLQPGIKVAPVFVDGEASPAAKFTAIGAQLMRATRKLELAVGDAHDESYPYSSLNDERLSIEWGRSLTADAALSNTATRSLDIASLARLIGPSSNLNPKLPAGVVTVVESIPSGVHEFTLNFPPTAITSSTDTAIVTLKAGPTLLTLSGHYYISGSTIYTYDATDTNKTITYTLTPSAWGSGPNYTGATFNVIPDPNQFSAGGNGCVAVLDGDGRYTITLPVCTQLSSSRDGTGTTLYGVDPLSSQQLILPRVLTDNYVSDEVIPAGFLYLKNWTTGEVYDDATYYYSTSSTLIVGSIDLENAIIDGDLLMIVTVGTDITTTLDDLRQKMAYHTHDRTYGEMAISAKDIVGWTEEEGASGAFTKSVMPGNYAPQYLHRDGYDAAEVGLNDYNVMRGDLALGVDGAAAGEYATASGSSYKLRFLGANVGGQNPTAYKDSDGALILDADMDIVPGSEEYDDPNLKGIRVKNGYLVPEKGIVSGLNTGIATYGGTGEFPAQIMVVGYLESGHDCNIDLNIDMTTFNLDPNIHRIICLNPNLRIATGNVVIGVNYDSANLEWDWLYYDHNASFTLNINFTGSAWSAYTSVEIYITIPIFFYEDANA